MTYKLEHQQVRVAIEPKHAQDLKELENAIERVSASDPCVEYEINRETGEIVRTFFYYRPTL